MAHTWHIHARVGFAEAAQVNDPRATEFGSPNYLTTLPYTRQPAANLWEINCWVMGLLRDRFAQ